MMVPEKAPELCATHHRIRVRYELKLESNCLFSSRWQVSRRWLRCVGDDAEGSFRKSCAPVFNIALPSSETSGEKECGCWRLRRVGVSESKSGSESESESERVRE